MSPAQKLEGLKEAIAYAEAAATILGTLNMEGEKDRADALVEELEHEYDYLLVTELPEVVEAMDAGPRFGVHQNF